MNRLIILRVVFGWSGLTSAATQLISDCPCGRTPLPNAVWVGRLAIELPSFNMTPLQKAQCEWELETTPYPKDHFYENGKKQEGTQQFRKYGQAIAYLNWDGECIEITKMEMLPNTGRRAAIPLVNFLKALADKYQVRIFGHVKPYKPDEPWPEDQRIPTQQELEAWYKRQGFHLCTRGKPSAVVLWYPNIPRFDINEA